MIFKQNRWLLSCLACNCDPDGSFSFHCTSTGICDCKTGFTGEKCDSCKSDYYRSGATCKGSAFSFMIHIL